jgi:hypothetical protein
VLVLGSSSNVQREESTVLYHALAAPDWKLAAIAATTIVQP